MEHQTLGRWVIHPSDPAYYIEDCLISNVTFDNNNSQTLLISRAGIPLSAARKIFYVLVVLYVFPLGLCDGHLIQTKMHFKLQTGNLRNLDNNSCWLHCQSEEKVQFMSVTYDCQSIWGLKISLLNYVTEPFKERSRAAFSFFLKNYNCSYTANISVAYITIFYRVSFIIVISSYSVQLMARYSQW